MQMVPWMGATITGSINLAVFTALVFMGLFCYFGCVLADPGTVPRDFQHDPEDSTAAYIQACTPATIPLHGKPHNDAMRTGNAHPYAGQRIEVASQH